MSRESRAVRGEPGASGASLPARNSQPATRTCTVKVCGVTTPEDARRAVDLGARYIGLNFWPRSPRYVTVEVAREIALALEGRAILVGVFVDEKAETVHRIDTEVGLNLLQFHGDEAPERLAPFGERAIKVFRIEDTFDPVQFQDYSSCGGWLFDVKHPDYGGTGETWNYALVRDLPTDKPVMVAGGINPQNARAAVESCQPDVIDICSGVESSPGVKDPQLMNQLFEEIGNESKVRLA